MTILSGVIIYILVFWVVIFTVLPWGNKPHQDAGMGTAGSAPENPRLLKKFLITGIISALIWVVIYILIRIDVIDFYDVARNMSAEDLQ